jgi:hypothetical protein
MKQIITRNQILMHMICKDKNHLIFVIRIKDTV